MERSVPIKYHGEDVTIENMDRQYILLQRVEPPYSLEDVSLATKQCFVRAFKEPIPVYFQSGALVTYKRIQECKYTEAEYAFLPIEKNEDNCAGIRELPADRCVYPYHIGDYLSIGKAYERILKYRTKNNIQIISDSYSASSQHIFRCRCSRESDQARQEYPQRNLFLSIRQRSCFFQHHQHHRLWCRC